MRPSPHYVHNMLGSFEVTRRKSPQGQTQRASTGQLTDPTLSAVSTSDHSRDIRPEDQNEPLERDSNLRPKALHLRNELPAMDSSHRPQDLGRDINLL